MDSATFVDATDYLQQAWEYLRTPIVSAPWHAWREFWLTKILDDRYIVAWFLPLLPILLLLRRDRLRIGIVLTGLVFVGYLFGAAYAGFWLLICVGLYHFAEWFAVRTEREPVPRWRTPMVAMITVGGGLLATMAMQHIPLPEQFQVWLREQALWLFPLGARAWLWEPTFPNFPQAGLFKVVFNNAHNIGTAYLAVRMLHYLSEIRRGGLPRERRTLLNFLAYLCYAPTLMQGPIERFAPFQHEMDTCHERRSWTNLPPALARIGLGLLKSLIATLYIAPLLWEIGVTRDSIYFKHPEQVESLWMLYTGVFWAILALYLEFSGYCDISAGFARLLGYRQIENFRRPWLATSMRDMWRRWHISLSFILRDYVYIALGGNRRHVLINLCVTFFLCGIWHSPILKVGLWGLLMGLMVWVNHRWVQWMKRLDEAPTGALPAIRRGWLKLWPLPQICAWLLTQHAFVLSLLLFFGGSGFIRVPREIFRRIWEGLT